MNSLIQKLRIYRHIRAAFPNELLYLKDKLSVYSTDQSILFFTVHRCASRYVTGILKKLAKDSGMIYADIEGYLWRGGKINSKKREIYKKYGYFFGPFYGLDEDQFTLPVPHLDDFKILLMLRDPRDVLTSYYFHHAYHIYSNPAKTEFILSRSRATLVRTIDEWVLEMAPAFLNRYKLYFESLKGKHNCLLSKYEDMVNDFNTWLLKIIEFVNLDIKNKTIESILNQANFKVEKEDVKKHKRQVEPGDHKRKLKKDTIKILNSQFEEILNVLNY